MKKYLHVPCSPDPTAAEDDDNDGEDEDKYVDEVDMPGTKVTNVKNSKFYYFMLVCFLKDIPNIFIVMN